MNRSMLMFQRTSWLGGVVAATALVFTLLPASPAEAKGHGVGGAWTAQGPAPVVDDLVNVPPDNGVVGAVHALVPHPESADILYIGSVNGGVWVTYDATAAKPHWVQLTDEEESQSIGALDLDPTDKKYRTMVAGPGAYSAYGDYGDLAGLLLTQHAGEPDKQWKRLTGHGVMLDKSVSGIAIRGRFIVAAVDVAKVLDYPNVGIFRSADNGNTFTQISQGNGSATGLPGGIAYDLAGDPLRPARLFTTVLFANGLGGSNGIYRTDDTGATWTKVSSPAIDAFLRSGPTNNVELTVGRHNNVYAAIVNNFVLVAFFRSGDGGATWTQMDLPVTIEDGTPQGIHPGGQGDFHLSLVADPTDANLVYIGGDRQPARNEADDFATRAIFPNSIGSTGFWGRLFRGDASKPSGSQWAHITHSNTLGAPGGGTASGSAPHVDSREMAFDAAGNLIEGDDGGVYRRTLPRSGNGDWFSLNGDLQITEVHDVALDRNTNTLFAGTQDNDAALQNLPGGKDWSVLLYGDGGDVDVDDTSTPDRSVRYTSVNFLRNLNRSTWNSAGALLGVRFLPLVRLDGAPAIVRQFYTPVRLSGGDRFRLVIGAQNGVYESFDRGETVRIIGPGIRTNSIGFQGVAYGSPANPDALYIGGSDVPSVFPGNKLWVRIGPPPAPLVRSLSYPGTLPIRALAIDPADGAHAFVVDAANVYRTTNAGVTWTNVTDDLVADLESSVLRSVTFANTPHGKAVVVGANRGVYIAPASEGYEEWSRLGEGMPTAPVLDVRYDPVGDRLTAGTLGRGVWTLNDIGLAVLMAQ